MAATIPCVASFESLGQHVFWLQYGHTLGTPIALFVANQDQRPYDYSSMSDIPRPSHADYTYQVRFLLRLHLFAITIFVDLGKCPISSTFSVKPQLKYGIRASSGGGRASARETIGRVRKV